MQGFKPAAKSAGTLRDFQSRVLTTFATGESPFPRIKIIKICYEKSTNSIRDLLPRIFRFAIYYNNKLAVFCDIIENQRFSGMPEICDFGMAEKQNRAQEFGEAELKKYIIIKGTKI